MTSHIHAKKSLGQNFLKDPHYLRKIAEVAGVGAGDKILEIGPGLGHLTRELVSRAQKVLALELDDRLLPILRKDFADVQNVEFVQTDALEFDYQSLPGTWTVVANLPYYISTPLIQRLLAERNKFTSMTLMLQKEVAERIAAPPGGREYGYLSVLVQLYTEPRLEISVPASAFTPSPEVDSAVITLKTRDVPAVAMSDEKFFIRLVKAAFSQRRKTLRNALKQLGFSNGRMLSAASSAGIDLGRRAETLSVQEFGRLAEALKV